MSHEPTAFHPIRSQADISHFLSRTNGLHDAYLIGVDYAHNGHTCGNPHCIDPDRSELHLRYLVTSIADVVVVLVFSGLYQWQLRDSTFFEITDTAVSFDEKGRLVWADDSSTEPELRESGSYVIAKTMQWRFL